MDDDERRLGARVIRPDLDAVGDGVPEDAVLDIEPDPGRRRLPVFEFEFCGLARQKSLQGGVLFDAIGYLVVGEGELARLLASVVPGRDIAVARRAFVHDGLGLEIESRVEVGHPVEEDGGLVRVSGLARHEIGLGKIDDAVEDRLLPLAVDEVGADEPPAVFAVEVAVAVVDPEPMKRIVFIGMLGVEKEAPVGELRGEDAVLVQARAAKGLEIVLREPRPAMRALHLPGRLQGIDLPRVHRNRFPAGRAMAVRPYHPRPGNGGSEHELPKGVVGHGEPGLGGFDGGLAGGFAPRGCRGSDPHFLADRLGEKDRAGFLAGRGTLSQGACEPDK